MHERLPEVTVAKFHRELSSSEEKPHYLIGSQGDVRLFSDI